MTFIRLKMVTADSFILRKMCIIMFSPRDHAYKTCTTHSHRDARTAHKYTHMLPHTHYTQQLVNSNAANLTISYTVSSQQTYCVRSSTYNVTVKVEYKGMLALDHASVHDILLLPVLFLGITVFVNTIND